VVEYPTVLEVRMLGRSKMKILRTIVGHLRLLARLAALRLSQRWGHPKAPVNLPAPMDLPQFREYTHPERST
jgi:hypothetical protein